MLHRIYALITALTLLATLANAQVVNIPDPNLNRLVRQKLGIPQGVPILESDMLQLTHMRWSEEGIHDLTGIEHATNLVTAIINVNPIEDLSPLGDLPRLMTIHMSVVPTKNLDWIANITTLRELIASNCGIEDISGLSNLTSLVNLRLEGNRIVDVSPLANLKMLESLWLTRNAIVDFSPIGELSIADLRRDEICDISRRSIQNRINNRRLPSMFLPWENGIRNEGGEWWDESISYDDRITYHDLWWHFPGRFKIDFILDEQGYKLAGDISEAIKFRDDLISRNPNMLILADLRQRYAPVSRFGEDWFGWLRDDNGNLTFAFGNHAFINFKLPEVEDVIVQRAVAVAQCGLVDGIVFDAWGIDRNAPVESRYSILHRIREEVPDDFLILFNTNHFYIPDLAPLINGSFMETFPDIREEGYTRDRIIEIESTLIKYELNAREPQINCLRGFGIGTEPPNSPNNL